MILCVTHSNDVYTIDRVMAYLKENGHVAIRVNTDQLLKNFFFTKELNESSDEVAIVWKDKIIKVSEVSGVWIRKIWPAAIVEEVDEGYRRDVGREIHTTLMSFLKLLEQRVPCINYLNKTNAVEGNKFFQLCVAKEVGLNVPNTCVTSDFETVKRFYEIHNGDIIAKLQNALDFSMQGGRRFFPTTKISESDLGLLKSTLSCCPMIFQNNIPKAYELRIAYVEGTCFAGKINATKTLNGKQDWRYSEKNSAFWEKYQLPIDEIEKIDQMMKRFELSFGAIDMIRKPNGTYVFLEVNPSGEWGMLQKDLGYPIAETIAKSLLKHIKLNEEKSINSYTY